MPEATGIKAFSSNSSVTITKPIIDMFTKKCHNETRLWTRLQTF